MNETDCWVTPNPNAVGRWNEKSVSSESVSIKTPILQTCYMKDNSKVDEESVSNRSISISTKETVNITLKHDGSVANFELRGTLYLHLFDEDDGYFNLQIETTGGDPRVEYDTPCSFFMDTDLYARENILAQSDCRDQWPTLRCGMPIFRWKMPIFRWKMPNADDVPLKIRCLHSVSGNETSVNLQYEASPVFQPMQDVVISIPFPAFQEVRNVKNTDGEWRYYFKMRVLEWSITRIDDSNCRGSLAFGIPVITDIMEFSPISVEFTSTRTFSDVKVVKILPLRANDPPGFIQKKQPTCFTESFQLV